jgi:hypothetical protein
MWNKGRRISLPTKPIFHNQKNVRSRMHTDAVSVLFAIEVDGCAPTRGRSTDGLHVFAACGTSLAKRSWVSMTLSQSSGFSFNTLPLSDTLPALFTRCRCHRARSLPC